MDTLDSKVIEKWLNTHQGRPQNYPHVAELISKWISKNNFKNLHELAKMSWGVNEIDHKVEVN